MKQIISFFVRRDLLVNLVSVFLMALGVLAIFMINREAFPNVNLDKIQIDVAYPGATPKEVEQLVVIPMEQELKALDGVDKIISVSFPGSGFITLELNPGSRNRDRIVSDVQLAIDRANLPNDLPDDPSVLEIEGSIFPVIQLAISAPLGELELKRLSDQIEDDLINLKGVARAIIVAGRKAEIRVLVKPKEMRRHRISVGEIATALSKWNINAPGGNLETEQGQKTVRVAGQFQSAEDVANLVLRANELGGGIRLGDVAEVTESLAKARRYNDVAGTPAVNMLVLKKSDDDIIDTVDRIKAYIKTVKTRYGDHVDITTFQDFSRFTRLRLGVLTNNGTVGIILVFLSLIMFLRPSVALTTTWGLPIVFFTGLYALYISGVTLNLLTMMGFIMVLGMLVDDAIIIGENITYYMEQGMKPHAAAVKGAVELIGPVTTTVMTTIIAFIPMLFMSGIIGKFIFAIPIAVVTLLFFSWLESFLILPSHVAFVTNAKAKPPEKEWLVNLEERYGRLLELALDHRKKTVGITLAVFVGAMLLGWFGLSFQLFPAVGIDQYIVRVTAPAGTSLESMRETLLNMDRDIRNEIKPQYLEATLIATGQIAIEEGDPLTQRGSRYGQIRAIYHPSVTRPEHSALEDMRRLEKSLPKKYPKLDIALTELRPGPPVGRAFQAELSSTDNQRSEQAARQLIEYLKKIEGVTTVEHSMQPGDPELHVVLDRKLATYAGVDLATVATHVRAAVGGLRVSTVRRGQEEVDVTIRFPKEKGKELLNLKQLQVSNQRGGLVGLDRIASFEEKVGSSAIRHIDGIRVVSVVANIDADKITSSELNKKVRGQQKEWLGNQSDWVRVNYGGEEEKNAQSFKDLGIAFGFALVGIFFILAIQFNRITYPFIVMLAIPFGAAGIVFSFFLHDLFWHPMPLSFLSMLGAVAMSGVVVNSSLILVVFIQRRLEEGMDYREAIISAGKRRLRAVILTATTTVVGLLPTAYGWGGMDKFVSPMALSLSSGLAFATVVTLIVIPAIFYLGHDFKLWLDPQLERHIGPLKLRLKKAVNKAQKKIQR